VIAVLGLTFKPNTDDMRDSPSLEIVPALQAAGATVRAFDPVGIEEAKKLLDGIEWCENAYDAMTGADAVAIITEWNEFRAIDLARIKELMKSPVMVDFRNIYNPEDMAAAGIHYSCVGRPSSRPQ
jgi:UDPglucose 6-dehydrogenase